MYVSKERVTRDGRLVAYKGEEMSEAEAIERGLIKADRPKAKTARRKAKPEPEDAPKDEEE